MNRMYNCSCLIKFRIIPQSKGTKNRKIYAEYGEGVSNINNNKFSYLKMDKFRLYKKDISNLTEIQKEIMDDLFLKKESRIKAYLYSNKKNILSFKNFRILKI